MRARSRYPLVLALLAVVLLQWGCAAVRTVPEHARAGLGTIGVAADTASPRASLDGSARRAAVARGARTAAGQGALGAAKAGLGLAGAGAQFSQIPIIGVPLVAAGLGLAAGGSALAAVLGAVGGAIHGAATAEVPPKGLQATLDGVVTQPGLQKAFRDKVLAAAARHTSLTLVGLPALPDDVTPSPDVILDVGFREIELETEGDGFVVVASARARLRRTTDGKKLSEHVVTRRSMARPYAHWAVDDAADFRDALAAASHDMAAEIVHEMFVRTSDPEPAAMPRSHAPRERTNFGRR
jgi:hypothetical protein